MISKKNLSQRRRTKGSQDTGKCLSFYFSFFIILTMSFIFIGCPMNEDDHEDAGFIPVGEWSDGFGSGYNITDSSIEYYSPDFGEEYPPQSFTGIIERAIDFSNDTGVLIIKIAVCENINLSPGKYTCVYYKDYTVNHVFLANPIGPEPAYETIEANTLDQAISLFNAGNMSTHVTHWGSGFTK